MLRGRDPGFGAPRVADGCRTGRGCPAVSLRRMIDPRLLTEEPDTTAAALARRGVGADVLDRLRELDAARRAAIAALDAARA